MAHVAELTELSVTQVPRLRAAAAGETRPGPDEAPPAGKHTGAAVGEVVRSAQPLEEAGGRAAS